jgi:microcystin-dependent protein
MYNLRFRGQYDSAVEQELDAGFSAIRAWLAVDHNEDGTHNLRPSGFDFVPIGALMQWGSASPPERWLICDGSAVSRTTYQSLFAILHTTYGAGDLSTTFNLPDLRQRFPLGTAASGTGATLGATGGAIDHDHTLGAHTHSINSDGSHNHSVSGTAGASSSTPEFVEALFNSGFSAQVAGHTHPVTGSTSSDGSHAHGGNTGSSSAGSTGAGNPPYVTVNFIILAGV